MLTFVACSLSIRTGPIKSTLIRSGAPATLVKRWVKRLRQAPATDETVLWNRSSARHHLLPPLHPAVIDRILEIRDHPPEHLQRTPGPKAILYYLHRQADLLAQGLRLPRSTRTIWQILTEHGRIGHPPRRVHVPMERPGPLVSWQIDWQRMRRVCRRTQTASCNMW